MNIKPLRDLIVIAEDKIEEVSEGGIALISDLKEKPATATVLAVGPGLYDDKGERIPVNVKAGDKIIFVRDSGTVSTVEGVEVRMITPDSLIGIID